MDRYNKTEWKDHIATEVTLFNFTDHHNGTATITPTEPVVEQQGTPVVARYLNNMENGIEENRDAILSLIDRIAFLEIQATINDALLGMPADNIIKQFFSNIRWVNINRGIYNPSDKCIMINEYIEGGVN